MANATLPSLYIADEWSWVLMRYPGSEAFNEFINESPLFGWLLCGLAAVHVLANLAAVRDRPSYWAVVIWTASTVVGSMILFGLWDLSLSDKGGLTLQFEFILVALLFLLATPTIKYWMVRGVYWVRGVDVP